MEFDEVIQKRHIVRDWKETHVSLKAIVDIIEAGLKAPSNDHLRNWEFIILHDQKEKETALQYVKTWSSKQKENKQILKMQTITQQMYAYAMPRQYSMLADAPYLIIPLFRGGSKLFKATAIHHLNSFASIWCVIENIFLAATAKGLGCSMRIPVGEEGKQVTTILNVPDEYIMPCYIGIGYEADAHYAVKQVERKVEDTLHFGKW
ncbi:MAG: nitroreductase family protein [Thomasclavelia sp.]